LDLFDLLIASLYTSPGATTPLIALVQHCGLGPEERTKILENFQVILKNCPENDKWFTISCLRCVNILAPFDANVGIDRMPILKTICDLKQSNEIRKSSLGFLGVINFTAILEYMKTESIAAPSVQLLSLIKSGIIHQTVSGGI
jgi:hypothetical protein